MSTFGCIIFALCMQVHISMVTGFNLMIIIVIFSSSKRGSGWGLVALPVFKTDVS